MAEKLKFTRPELKRQRDALARFRRYLPMLKLKQQQLQIALRETEAQQVKIEEAYQKQSQDFATFAPVLNDYAGVAWAELLQEQEIRRGQANVAGVRVPYFESISFAEAEYSLFSTPLWVDATLVALRKLKALQAEMLVLRERQRILRAEFQRTMQRVNLFEKVKIPQALENMRRIRIQLGDELAAAVGRAKTAKSKIAAREQQA